MNKGYTIESLVGDLNCLLVTRDNVIHMHTLNMN